MLKIGRSEGDEGSVIFTLSGRLGVEHISELQQLLKSETARAALTIDLEEVRLVDRAAVKFLAACKVRGIKLQHCPSYIREWIETGSDTNHEI